MPFKSEAQRKLCYLLKNKGQAGSWDCSEWSKETPKGKKLPEHVSEKKSEDLETVKKLARCWAGYKPVPGKEPYSEDSCKPVAKSKDTKKEKKAELHSLLFKRSSVVTSPGRGTGDEEATTINPEPYEGMQKAEPVKKVPGKMSFNNKPNKPVSPMGAARNAAAKASIKAFGFDPRGGVPAVRGEALPAKGGVPVVKGGAVKSANDGTGASARPSPTSSVSQFKTPSISPMQVMQGAVPAVGNAFRAGFGNDEAYNRLKAQAAGPNIQQGLKDWGQTFSALGQTAKTVPGNFVRAAVNNPENKLSIINKYTGIGDKGAKYVDDTVNNLFKPNQQVAGGGALSKAYSALPAPIKAVASGVSDATTAAGQGIAQGVANKLTQAEGGRMAANYALPIVDFFRNNPWAKWALGGAAALGAYGLGRSLFGSEDYDEENAPQTLFNQGYGKVYQPRALRVSE